MNSNSFLSCCLQIWSLRLVHCRLLSSLRSRCLTIWTKRAFRWLGVSSTSYHTRAPISRTLPVYTPSLVSCSTIWAVSHFLFLFLMALLFLFFFLAFLVYLFTFWRVFCLLSLFRGGLLRLRLTYGGVEENKIHYANKVALWNDLENVNDLVSATRCKILLIATIHQTDMSMSLFFFTFFLF